MMEQASIMALERVRNVANTRSRSSEVHSDNRGPAGDAEAFLFSFKSLAFQHVFCLKQKRLPVPRFSNGLRGQAFPRITGPQAEALRGLRVLNLSFC
jgi:hypothetical protein